MFSYILSFSTTLTGEEVKAWIRRNWVRLNDSDQPEMELLEACGVVTAEKARQWFAHSGYKI